MLKVDIEQALIQLRVSQLHVVLIHISIAKNVYRKTHTTFLSENKLTKMTKIKSNNQFTSRYTTPLYVLGQDIRKTDRLYTFSYPLWKQIVITSLIIMALRS
jgi:hypothetical protein